LDTAYLAGSVESVATILQLYHGFVFPNINCEDLILKLQPSLMNLKFRAGIKMDLNIIKASFGFGDVNSCIIFKKYKV
jgi:3-oxoacyl-(acyl-carrier-protein) synthase